MVVGPPGRAEGRSFFLYDVGTPAPDLHLQTAASGTIGWGAYFDGRWIHSSSSESEAQESIEYKELHAIVAAWSTWGEEWTRLQILLHCDNAAVVDVIKSEVSHASPSGATGHGHCQTLLHSELTPDVARLAS